MISREEAVGILSNQAQNAANILAVIPKSAEEKAQALMNEIEALDMAIEALSQPERPKGRWVVENEDSIRCPECCYNRARIKHPLNFCPECGCDMRGEEE